MSDTDRLLLSIVLALFFAGLFIAAIHSLH